MSNDKPKKAAKDAAPKKPPPKKAPPHPIRFLLLEPNFDVVKEPRQYKIQWTDTGAETGSEISGTTEGGLTQKVATLGKVRVTLEISSPENSECKPVSGSAESKPIKEFEIVKVVQKVATIAVSAPKSENSCPNIEVREGKQTIQYAINVAQGDDNQLRNLPYLIVDIDKMQVLKTVASDVHAPVLRFKQGTLTSPALTDKINCDGVKKVGLVFGNATDDPARWQDPANNLILYQVEPKASGDTQVVITEKWGATGEKTPPVENYTANLYGQTWAHVTRRWTMAEVQALFPGELKIVVDHPTEMQLDYAQSRKLITAADAAEYRAVAAQTGKDAKNALQLPMKPLKIEVP